MNSPLAIYQQLIDDLRDNRRRSEYTPEDDRELLAKLEDFYEMLTDEERSVVESEGWRSWPDLYDARPGDA